MVSALLATAAAVEAATGLALAVCPTTVVRLLFGAALDGAGVAVGRVAGMSLVALGVACWPNGAPLRALCGMLTYNALVAIYLAHLGIGGERVGPLLWPAAAVHAILTSALGWAWLSVRQARGPMLLD